MNSRFPGSQRCRVSCVLFLAPILLFVGTMKLQAQDEQEPSCSISGKVTNQSGTAIPKARIAAIKKGGGRLQNASSATDGSFALRGLSPGQYIVTAEASGLTPKSVDVSVEPGTSNLANFTLAPITTGSSVVGEVGSKSVREIPLNGRSATDVATLEPGVATARTQSSGGAAQRGFGTQITISGGRPRQNDSRLDGISVNDYANSPAGSAAGVNLGVDAVEHVSVLSSNYPAQYGRSSGGIVSSSTRSGTNHFHGSVFEFFRNSALDARNYFDLKKPPFKRNQFGGTIGGPVWNERTFFFFAYEGFRQSLGVSQVSTVPSAAARSGPAVDPGVLRFVNAFYPLPNGPILSSGDRGIFNFAGQQVIPDDYFNSRVDHKLSQHDLLSGTYMHDSATVREPDEFNNKRTGYDSHRQLFTVNEVHTSGNLVNSVRLGINRVVATTGLSFAAANTLAADPSFGTVPGRNAATVNVAGMTSFTGGIGVPSGYQFHWTSIQGYEDLSLVKGRHTLKLGGGFERVRDNILADSDPGGVFSFNSLADFLANKPFSLTAEIPGSLTERGLRQTIASVYVQDHWNWKSSLGFDFGLRYEVSTVPTEVKNRLTVLRNLTDAAPHVGSPLFSNPTLRNFEPRVGFSWSPFGDTKSIISAGFGMFDVLPLPYLVQFNEVNSAPFAQQGNATNLPAGSFPNTAFAKISTSSNTLRQAYFEPNPPRSYVMQWNLNVQRELARGLSVTAAYVGSRGIHQPFRVEDADIVLPVATPQGYVWPKDGTGQRLNSKAGRITAGFWRSDSYFHALEMKVQGDSEELQSRVPTPGARQSTHLLQAWLATNIRTQYPVLCSSCRA